MPIRLLLFSLLLFSFLDKPKAQKLQNDNYSKGIMTFDLTFNNPNTNKTLHVIKVGVRNKVVTGNFNCSPFYPALIPMADYVVEFWVGGDRETIINADPILVMEPQKTVRFTISIIPNAVGSCGYWASEVSAIVVFDDGTKYYSLPQQVTRTDFEKYQKTIPTEDETIMALRHRDPRLRVQGINNLIKYKTPTESKEIILSAKLKDEDSRVRKTALEAISKLKLKSLSDTVLLFLENAKDNEEIARACETLGEIGNEKAVTPLVYSIVDLKNIYTYAAPLALKKLGFPSTANSVNKLLVEKKNWMDKTVNEHLQSRYLDLCELAVYFQNKESIPILREILKSKNDFITRNTLREIKNLQDENMQTKNPFILSFENAFKQRLFDTEFSGRDYALDLVCMINSNKQYTYKIIGQFLKDKSEWVKATAAKWAGNYKLKDYKNLILTEYKRTKDYRLKDDLCEALKQLDVKCNPY